jgi:hypothetical protein
MKALSAQSSIIPVIILLLFTTACKKDKAAATQILQGIWADDPKSMGVVRTITFGKDSVYYVIQNRAIYVLPPIYKGVYEVRGNRLLTRFSGANLAGSSFIPQEFSAAAGAPGFYELFAGGSFSFEGNRLVIKYTASANGQAQPATATFYRSPTD